MFYFESPNRSVTVVIYSPTSYMNYSKQRCGLCLEENDSQVSRYVFFFFSIRFLTASSIFDALQHEAIFPG